MNWKQSCVLLVGPILLGALIGTLLVVLFAGVFLGTPILGVRPIAPN